MSNLKISQLPEFTGNTSGSYLVMNNSGETTTFKVKKENYIFPYNGNASLTGSLNILGNTTITGSLNVSGSAFSDVNINGRIQITTPNGTTGIGGNINPTISVATGSGIIGSSVSIGNISVYNDFNDLRISSTQLTGSPIQILSVDNTNVSRTIIELPCSSSWNDGLTEFKYPVEITGSITLSQQSTLPTGTVGSLAVSGSNLYYHNGTSWSQIN